jgi:aspartyl protease family protein
MMLLRNPSGRGVAPSRWIGALLVLMLWMPVLPAFERIAVVGLFKDRAILDIDGVQRALSAGETSPEGITLVTADSREAVLELNGERRILTLEMRVLGVFQAPLEAGISVTVPPDGQGMYFVNGLINGFHVDFIVDTGATLISMNRNEAARIGVDYRLEGRPSESRTASGPTRVYLVTLNSVRVGDIELRNVPAAVHDGDFPEIILLGNSFLNHVDLERQGRMLRLRKR